MNLPRKRKKNLPLDRLDFGNAIFVLVHIFETWKVGTTKLHTLLFTSNFLHLLIKQQNSGWPWPVLNAWKSFCL